MDESETMTVMPTFHFSIKSKNQVMVHFHLLRQLFLMIDNIIISFCYTPCYNEVKRGVYCLHVVRPSVPSVTLCFLNILKPLSRNFMKPCTHIHIDGANIMIKHKGLGASSVRVISLCNS